MLREDVIRLRNRRIGTFAHRERDGRIWIIWTKSDRTSASGHFIDEIEPLQLFFESRQRLKKAVD